VSRRSAAAVELPASLLGADLHVPPPPPPLLLLLCVGCVVSINYLVLIRPPERKFGRAYVLPVMFFSPRFLRDLSTDRPETLPHDGVPAWRKKIKHHG